MLNIGVKSYIIQIVIKKNKRLEIVLFVLEVIGYGTDGREGEYLWS